MLHSIKDQIISIKKRDPAARSFLEIILCYQGLHALFFHRLSNFLWRYHLLDVNYIVTLVLATILYYNIPLLNNIDS